MLDDLGWEAMAAVAERSHADILSDTVAPNAAETEKDKPQIRLCHRLGVGSSLRGKRAVGDRVIKRKRLFIMWSG